MNAQNARIGIKGRVRAEVVNHLGEIVLSRPWQPNLLLDQGLNNLADVYFAQLFSYAAAGTGTTATKETVDVANSFTLAGTTLTRTAGTRDFTVDDVGKLVRRADTPFTEGIITALTSVTEVELRAVGQTALANYTAKDILLYSVQQVGLDAEVGSRTNDYSAITGDNGTADVSNVRTLTRTFIFEPVAEIVELATDTDPAATYSRAGGTVSQVAGTRDFTAADVGKYIYFPTAGVLTKITGLTDATVGATQVSVDSSGVIAAEAIEFYGFIAYGEVGFSHLETAGDNLNVRVRLESAGVSDPVPVYGENPETPGQQLRLTYELEVTVTPNTNTAGTALITDTGNLMSGNKTGAYVIERLALSSIDNDGATNTQYATLEPAEAASAGLSPDATALAALNGPDRSEGATSVELVADTYVTDSFTRTYEGTFGINDAIGTNWRVLGLFDTTSETFPFTFRFAANQAKTAAFALTVRFRKTWNRDLS